MQLRDRFFTISENFTSIASLDLLFYTTYKIGESCLKVNEHVMYNLWIIHPVGYTGTISEGRKFWAKEIEKGINTEA